VRVYTLQGYDLRRFRGPIDLAQGSKKNNDTISDAQRRLYSLIGENQVVWCRQDGPVLHGETGRYLHDIDVDRRDIVAVVDSLIWCHYIGYECHYIPREEHAELEEQAIGSDDPDIALQELEDKYLAANLPKDLWSGVTKTEVNRKSDQLLLKFPFDYSTIANVDFVTEEMAKNGRRDRRRTLSAVTRQPRT